MPFDTPPLRVSRPIAACAPCRRTKSKCDGKLPVCSSCEKSGKADQCASNTTDTRETSYVATLETRKAVLEKAFNDARTRRKSVLGLVEASSSAEDQSQPATTSDSAKPPKRTDLRKEAVRVDDLVGDFGLMSISATSRDFYGFTPETSYARFVLCSSVQGTLPVAEAGTYDLPKGEDANRIFQEVLAKSLAYLPILDELTIWSASNRVYADPSAKPLDHYIINMLLAIHAAQQSKTAGQLPSSVNHSGNIGGSGSSRSVESTQYLSQAMSHSSQVLRPGSVTSIQALLLLAVYAYLDPTHFDSWTVVGFATRAMVDIGMHHDPPKSSVMPRPELNLRRRVYWCVYSLDRLASMSQRRPFSFSDNSTGVAPPPPGSCPAGAASLFALRQMQSQAYTSLYQPSSAPSYDGQEDPWAYVWRTHGKMGEWLQRSLRGADPSTAAVVELEYAAGCAFLLSPSPRCPLPDGHATAVRQQHASRFAALAHECRDLFYIDALASIAG